MQRISIYLLGDLLKNKVIIGYFLLLSLAGWGAFMMESQPEKALLLLMQVTLMVLPLITMVFATIYYYYSLEFILLLLSQPIERKTIINSFYTGLVLAFMLVYLLGMGLPLLVYYPTVESAFLLCSGLLLTVIFSAIAIFISTHVQDKARGMGVTLLVWAFFAFIYDGLLLYGMYQLAAYPIEKGVLAVSFLNPVDIARILVIMKTEASAMMGLSGAVFRKFLSSGTGTATAIAALLLWAVIPFLFVRRKFNRKDM